MTPYLPPHSIEAEQSVLGGLMLDNATWDLIADIVGADDFYRSEHRKIFQAINSLADHGDPFDVVTIAEELCKYTDEIGLAYLGELAKNTPSVANIVSYANVVAKRAHLRKLITLGNDTARLAYEPDADVEAVHEACEGRLFALSQSNSKSEFVDIAQALMGVVDEIDRNFNSDTSMTGVPSGLEDLDALTAGFQPADLIIVAGRPSMGKTSLVLNWIKPILDAEPNKTVQFYSLEMPARLLLYRMLALLGHLDGNVLMKGKLADEDWPRLTSAVQTLKQLEGRLVIDDEAGLSPTALRARARRAARKFGTPAAIMVDYLQMMRVTGRENRNLEIAEISGALKGVAKEFNCPVIALSQLNRAVEQRPNKRPVNADLRESGAIEQDADIIMFVYRDEVYHPNTEDKGVAELIFGKFRNGPTTTVRTAFIGKETRFANLSARSLADGVYI
ncbi:replicative DNA helicase [Pseudomonas sp. PA15(2017)]|uniref:replicative DNA helicase n=1 Tax=Pseudomonas sp. PA15(2017) TaxID=1932111 RepID=UPI0009672291|nr:replicative DNA helicase [Pseudomonas sp. PA15(2017)]OLU25465.1 replicative DNA helicase [Pseudomonas sp. PA15(2017)]